MLDLREYSSLGAALRAALERWPDEICLIEADRERENCRLTYRQFKEAGAAAGRGRCRMRGLRADSRAAIIMTNQSKWLISAYAIFHCGGVLVPLDYKLTARGASAASGALASAISDCRIPSVARDHASGRFRGLAREDGARDGSARRTPSCMERSDGKNFAMTARQCSSNAQTRRLGVHRVFLGNGRAAQGLRDDA